MSASQFESGIVVVNQTLLEDMPNQILEALRIFDVITISRSGSQKHHNNHHDGVAAFGILVSDDINDTRILMTKNMLAQFWEGFYEIGRYLVDVFE